jgi:hypothetical protein
MLVEQYTHALPALAATPRHWLAKLVCAVVEAGACTQPALATALQRLGLSRATNESLQVAIRRFLSDPRVTAATAYAPLVRAVLAQWPADRLLVIVDTTTLKDRLIRLQVSLAYHGRCVPLSWAVYPASGVPTETTWQALFATALADAQALLPADRPVLVLFDRGFTSPTIWDAVLARGWHPVLRALRTVRLRTTDGTEQPLAALLDAPPGLVTEAGAVFKKGGWRAATVTAIRRDGMAEAWLLLSDLPAGEQRALEYAVRMHIEQSFRDDKRHGWQWEHSRVTDPARASRLLLVLQLATLWVLSAGAGALQTGRARHWVRLSRPAWSLFRIGWTWLQHAFAQGELVPVHHRLLALPTWPTPLLGSRTLLHT